MKRFLAPAGHIIYWKEIFTYLFSNISRSPLSIDDLKPYLLNSGTSALAYLLMKLKPINLSKNEVIIPAYTCPTLAAAIIKSGLKPVICDISLSDFSLLIEDLQIKINEKTLAIIQVELFGILPENEKVREIVDQNKLIFIGDAAQSLGNYLNNNKLLQSQKYDFLIFSTGRGKPINLLHGGGLFVLNDRYLSLDMDVIKIQELNLQEKLKSFMEILFYKIFLHPRLYNIPRSLPFLNLGKTELSLNIVIKSYNKKLKYLFNSMVNRYTQISTVRLKAKEMYLKLISKYSSFLLPVQISEKHELIRFPVLFSDAGKRDLVMKELELAGIGATGLYPFPLNNQPGLESYQLDACTNASLIADNILTLPIHEYVSESDYKKIGDIFDKCLIN